MKPQDIDKKHPNTSRNCTKLKAYVKELTRAYAIVYTSVVNEGEFTCNYNKIPVLFFFLSRKLDWTYAE